MIACSWCVATRRGSITIGSAEPVHRQLTPRRVRAGRAAADREDASEAAGALGARKPHSRTTSEFGSIREAVRAWAGTSVPPLVPRGKWRKWRLEAPFGKLFL